MNTSNPKDTNQDATLSSQGYAPKRIIPLPNINKLPTLKQLQQQAAKKSVSTAVSTGSSSKLFAKSADSAVVSTVDKTGHNTVVANPHVSANTPIDSNVSPFANLHAVTTASHASSKTRGIEASAKETTANNPLETKNLARESTTTENTVSGNTVTETPAVSVVTEHNLDKTLTTLSSSSSEYSSERNGSDLEKVGQSSPLLTAQVQKANESASGTKLGVVNPQEKIPSFFSSTQTTDVISSVPVTTSEVQITTNNQPSLTTNNQTELTTDSLSDLVIPTTTITTPTVSSHLDLEAPIVALDHAFDGLNQVKESPLATINQAQTLETKQEAVANILPHLAINDLTPTNLNETVLSNEEVPLNEEVFSNEEVSSSSVDLGSKPDVEEKLDEEEDFLTRYNKGYLDLPEFDPEFFAEPKDPQAKDPRPKDTRVNAPKPITTATSFHPKTVEPPKVGLIPMTKVPLMTPTMNAKKSEKSLSTPDATEVIGAKSAQGLTSLNQPEKSSEEEPVIFTPSSAQELEAPSIQTTPYGTVDDLNQIIASSSNSPKLQGSSVDLPLAAKSVIAIEKLTSHHDDFKVSSHSNSSVNYNGNRSKAPTGELEEDFVYTDSVVATASQTLDTDHSYSSEPAKATNSDTQTASSSTLNYNPNDLVDDYAPTPAAVAVNDLVDLEQKSVVESSSLNSFPHQPSSGSTSSSTTTIPVVESKPTTTSPALTTSEHDPLVPLSNSMPQTTETNSTNPQAQYHVRTEADTTNTPNTIKAPVSVKLPSVLASSIPHKGDSYDYVHNRIATFFGIVALLAVMGLFVYLAYILFKIIW